MPEPDLSVNQYFIKRDSSSKVLGTQHFHDIQNHRLEVFCQKFFSYKFRKFHRKTLVMESVFNKETLTLVFSCEKWLYSQRCFDVNQRCETWRWKQQLVLALSNAVNMNVEIDNVDLTLFNVVNFNVEIPNFVSTLI